MASLNVVFRGAPLDVPVADLITNGPRLLDAFGTRTVKWIQAGPWADNKFVRATGRSRRAWAYKIHQHGIGLTIYNDAVNRYGTPYAKFVHYAGTPRSTTVASMVGTRLFDDARRSLIPALLNDFRAGLKRRERG